VRRKTTIADDRDVRPWILVALAIGLLVLTRPGRAAAQEGPWFPLNVWSQKQGLPETTIRALLETRDGYLWIATHAGLARFDGARFTVFDDRNKGPLREIEVQALAEGDDGSVWIGTYGGGLSRFKDGRFTTYTKAQGLINDFVTSLCSDGRGGLWIGTDGGLSHLSGGRFESFTAKDGLFRNEVHALARDSDGSLWIATRNGGLTRFKDGELTVESIDGISTNVIVRAILRDRAGALWLASHIGLVRIKDGTITRYTRAEGLSSERSYCLHEDATGTIWICGDSGLSWYRDGQVHAVPDFAGTGTTAATSNREGCVWVGSGALTCLAQSQFVNYTVKDGLVHQYVTTFLEDRQGSVWIGGLKGLSRWRDGAAKALGAAEGLPSGFVGGLALDADGSLWVGTDAGIYRSRAPLGEAIPQFQRVENQPSPTIQARAMFVDRAGTLWIGSVMEGLVRYQGGAFTVYTTKDGLLHNAVRGIVEDRAGNLWMGTRAGLNRMAGGKLTGYTVKDGLASDTVEALYLDRDDVLWISTRQGVNRFAGGRFTRYTVDDGLLCSYVNSFAEDDLGNMWMSCMRGVFRVPRRQLEDFAAGKISAVTATAYGVEHGLVSTRATAGFDRAAYKTRDGRVWFATVRGASVVDPRHLRKNTQPPPVEIEEVHVDGRLLPKGKGEAIPGRGDIDIRYTALSFLAPEKVRFKYRLAGYDPDWVAAENRRAAYYSNIPPGHYTFQVIAANNDGVWNEAGASFSLHLRPHWYQTWLFRGSALLLGLVLAAGAFRRRVRQLERRQRELERSVVERTAELAAANKELESFSYSVSHDLRAPLRRIEGFGRALVERHAAQLDAGGQELVGRMRRASESMERLIDDMLALARVTSSEMRRTPVDLSELAQEIVDELRARQPDRRVEVVLPPAVTVLADANLIRIALANLLGNAWKFTGKNPTASIELGVIPSETPPVFFVRDDGVGFDPTEAGRLFTAFQRLHSPAEFEGSGVGLATVARVIERHGGRVWAEGAPGKGASFYFTVPHGQ
jgi:ligand-binding sensor domain-containing protein/signal transduction histidine kinase